jgi:hypothetical protein
MQLITKISEGYSDLQKEVAALNAKVAIAVKDGKVQVTFMFEKVAPLKKWASFSLIEGQGGRGYLFFHDNGVVVGLIDDLAMEDVVRYAGLELAEAKALADSEGRKSSRWQLEAVPC